MNRKQMTVDELIDKLKEYSGDTVVRIFDVKYEEFYGIRWIDDGYNCLEIRIDSEYKTKW